MDDGTVARYDLGRCHPSLTFERQLHINKLPWTLALSRHFHLRRFDDQIWWTPTGMIPALCKLRRSRHGVSALRGTRINPCHNLVDLCLSEAAIVLPFARFSIGVPGRHLVRNDLGLDRASPWPHFVVRHKRHRRHLSRSMARGTLFVQDRSNVFAERRRRCLGEDRCR
jgi:hypothetical protein